jgi:hypothetical protein
MFPLFSNQSLLDFPNVIVDDPRGIPDGDYKNWPYRMGASQRFEYVLSSSGVDDLRYLHNGITGQLLQTFTNSDAGGPAIVSPDGKIVGYSNSTFVVSGNANVGRAYLVNSSDYSSFRIIENPNVRANCNFGSTMNFSPDGKRIAVGADLYRLPDAGGTNPWGAIFIYDVQSGALIRQITHPAYSISATYPGTLYFGSFASMNYDGSRVLISCGFETHGGKLSAGKAYLYDVATGALLRTFVAQNISTTENFGGQVILSPNGKNAYIREVNLVPAGGGGTSYIGKVKCHNADTGAVLFTMQPSDIAGGASFSGFNHLSADGCFYYLQSNFSTVNYKAVLQYDAKTGALIKSFRSPSSTASNSFGLNVQTSFDNARITIADTYKAGGDPDAQQGDMYLQSYNDLLT